MKRAFASAVLLLALLALPAAFAQGTRTVDLDLTKMSSTVVYSQISNMMTDPTVYLGKVLRIAGWYDFYEDEETGAVYTACIIPDATACCAQGLEFVWAGEHRYPEDYPESGTGVMVTGRLESYTEDDVSYLHLVDAEVLWDSTVDLS